MTSTVIRKTSNQTTLGASIECAGIGLHGGAQVVMELHPAPAGTGVVFQRTDISDTSHGKALVPARYDRVSDTRLCTVLSNEAGISVGTVEHLMAALAGCGVDNVRIDINGPEVPIMDGSAAPFVDLVRQAGITILNEPRRVVRVLEPVVVDDGEKQAGLYPHDGFVFECEVDFETPVIGRQAVRVSLDDDNFIRDVLSARTFGFLEDLKSMKKAGLARGGSLDNAIVIGGSRVLNPGGLRHKDEFVRHKLLDAVGDLYLAAMPIQGLYRGVRAGHAINNRLVRALFAHPDAWTFSLADTLECDRAPDRPAIAAE